MSDFCVLPVIATDEEREKMYIDEFNKQMELFFNGKTSVEQVIETYENIKYNKKKVVEKYLGSKLNEKFFEFMIRIKTDIFNTNLLSLFFFRYYVFALNNNKNVDDIWENIAENFFKLEHKFQVCIMDDVMFGTSIFESKEDSTNFLNKCYMQTGGFEKYGFEIKFNALINKSHYYDYDNINTFYEIVYPFCLANCHIMEVKYKDAYCAGTKMFFVEEYLENLKKYVNNPVNILMNKLNIIKFMIDEDCENQTYHFKTNKNLLNGVIRKRIFCSSEYQKLEKQFYDRFIGYLLIDYNMDNYDDITFISIGEMKYKVDDEYNFGCDHHDDGYDSDDSSTWPTVEIDFSDLKSVNNKNIYPGWNQTTLMF